MYFKYKYFKYVFKRLKKEPKTKAAARDLLLPQQSRQQSYVKAIVTPTLPTNAACSTEPVQIPVSRKPTFRQIFKSAF